MNLPRIFASALVDLFNKADVTKSGCITLKDYINICEDHGMKLYEDDLEIIKALVNEYGKVSYQVCIDWHLLQVLNLRYREKTSSIMSKLQSSWTALITKTRLVINIGIVERTWHFGDILYACFNILSIKCRIFDINSDGFVSKEEFGWMTTSKIIGIREIEKVFLVGGNQ